MAEDNKIQIAVEVQDNASSKLEKVAQGVKNVGSSVSQLSKVQENAKVAIDHVLNALHKLPLSASEETKAVNIFNRLADGITRPSAALKEFEKLQVTAMRRVEAEAKKAADIQAKEAERAARAATAAASQAATQAKALLNRNTETAIADTVRGFHTLQSVAVEEGQQIVDQIAHAENASLNLIASGAKKASVTVTAAGTVISRATRDMTQSTEYYKNGIHRLTNELASMQGKLQNHPAILRRIQQAQEKNAAGIGDEAAQYNRLQTAANAATAAIERDSARAAAAIARQAAAQARLVQQEERQVTTGRPSSYTGAVAMGTLISRLSYRAVTFGKNIAKSFADVANGTRELQLVIGGTAEDMSKLRFASTQLGVDTSDLSLRMAQAQKHFVLNDKYAKALGVSYKDMSGNVKPATQLLGEIGDRLNAIQDPFARATLARDIFGRGFTGILPLLEQGSRGINQLTKEADKFGLVMSTKDIQAQRAFSLQAKELKSSIQGLFVTIGRELAPALSGLIGHISNLINKFTHAYRTSENFRANVQKVIKILGGLVVGLGVAAAAAAAFGAIISIVTSPVTIVILALEAWMFALYKLGHAHKWIGSITIQVGEIFGNLAGKAVAVAIFAFLTFANIVLDFAKIFLKVSEWVTGTSLWKHLFGDKQHTNIKAMEKDLGTFTDKLNEYGMKAGKWAWDNGGKIGKKLTTGLVNAVENFKMPSIGDMLKGQPGATVGAGGGTDTVDFGGGGGGGGKKKNPVLDYFSQLVAQARTVLNTLREKAVAAKKEMDDLAKKTSDDLKKSLSLSEIGKLTGGGYGGPTAMLRMFQKRLDDLKVYVANIKTLKSLGLPSEMLADLVNMGMLDGAQMAKMLVANPAAIPQLAALQAQISAQTAEAGTVVAEAVYGGNVSSATQKAVDAQTSFNTLLGKGKKFGYTPSTADIEASTTNINNQVYMDVGTNADPARIQEAIAWALKTGGVVQFGRAPAGRRSGGGNAMTTPNLANYTGKPLGPFLFDASTPSAPLAAGLQGPAAAGAGFSSSLAPGLQGIADTGGTGLNGPATAGYDGTLGPMR